MATAGIFDSSFIGEELTISGDEGDSGIDIEVSGDDLDYESDVTSNESSEKSEKGQITTRETWIERNPQRIFGKPPDEISRISDCGLPTHSNQILQAHVTFQQHNP